MKRLLSVLAGLTLSVALFGSAASAGEYCGPSYGGYLGGSYGHAVKAYDPYCDCVYHVYYYDCSCGHWKCYGTYHREHDARFAAFKLEHHGYRVKIKVAH